MRHVLHCPHCRKKVVVDRDGIQRALPRVANARSPPIVNPSVTVRKTRQSRKVSSAALVVGSIVAVVIAGVLLRLVGGGRTADGPVAASDLAEAAEAFQCAWLVGDLALAAKFVSSADQAKLKSWAGPRRAALIASFGQRFVAQITAVEVTQKTTQEAVVRVCFAVRGGEQQTFQNWKLIGPRWRIVLD
jgi:hypothetical protein